MKRVKNSNSTSRVVWIDTTIASSTMTTTLPSTSTSALARAVGRVHQRDDRRRQAGVRQRERADAGERQRVDQDLQRLLDQLADRAQRRRDAPGVDGVPDAEGQRAGGGDRQAGGAKNAASSPR